MSQTSKIERLKILHEDWKRKKGIRDPDAAALGITTKALDGEGTEDAVDIPWTEEDEGSVAV